MGWKGIILHNITSLAHLTVYFAICKPGSLNMRV